MPLNCRSLGLSIWSILTGILLGSFSPLPLHAADTEQEPWRVSDVLGLPAWFRLSGDHRLRYETLEGQFRTNRQGNEHILVMRTSLQAALTFDRFEFVTEFMDSRQELADRRSPINTTIVNSFELLQSYLAVNFPDVVQEGDTARLQLGRQTMDFGSRRLIARNRFRNTINNFTGINTSWTAASGHTLRAFYFLPVNRLPADTPSLLRNHTEADEEDFDWQFWGVAAEMPQLLPNINGELFLFGMHEDDSPDQATADRTLYTPGFRLYRKPATGQFDAELESVFQAGHSRSSTAATNTTDFDHFAHFQHVEVGYSFAVQWSPRLVVQFDYASGDDNPNDDNNNRFDTLFGARRFDFGPTGIYGSFARSNLISPGYRLFLKPHARFNIMFAHRFYWLAADRDAWTTSGVRDPTGKSGSYLGAQPEIRLQWDILPGNAQLEAGAAYLFSGEFEDGAPNSNGEGDTSYAYVQTVFTF